MHPQKEPNFPFRIAISSLQLGHFGSLTETFECLEQTGISFELSLVAKEPHSAHFIKIKKEKEEKEFKTKGKKQKKEMTTKIHK